MNGAKPRLRRNWRLISGRARVFDGKWVRLSFDALCQFSKDDLTILGNILPVSNPERRKLFPGRERQLLDAFEETFKQMVLSRREQMIEEAGLTALEPLRNEAVEIRRRAPAIFKKIAQRLECEIRKAEPSVWMLSAWNAGEKSACLLISTRKWSFPITSLLKTTITGAFWSAIAICSDWESPVPRVG